MDISSYSGLMVGLWFSLFLGISVLFDQSVGLAMTAIILLSLLLGFVTCVFLHKYFENRTTLKAYRNVRRYTLITLKNKIKDDGSTGLSDEEKQDLLDRKAVLEQALTVIEQDFERAS